MSSRWLLCMLAGVILVALLPAVACAAADADDRLDQVTDLMRVGRMDEAMENLTAMQTEYPDNLRAWLIRGLILAYIGDDGQGRDESRQRLEARPGDGGGLALAIGLDLGVGDDESARNESARLVASFPASADAWDIRGYALSLSGSEEANREAEAAFDRALAIDPNHVDALINRGELAGPTDPAAAERFLRRAVEARPASSDANDAWTAFLVGQNRTSEALEAYDAWLGHQPRNPVALIGKATLLAEAGRYTDALWLVENAVRDDPGYRDGLYLKGQLLLALGRPGEAVAAMNDLLARYPGDEDAEALRTEAAAAVQNASATGNATAVPGTTAARSPVPAFAAVAALGILVLDRARRR